MNKKLKIAAVAAAVMAVGATSARASVVGSTVDSPLVVTSTIDWVPDLTQIEQYNALGMWSITSTFDPFAWKITIQGQHMVAPHGLPELAPNPSTFNAVFPVPPPAPPGNSVGPIVLQHGNIPGHTDMWVASVSSAPAPAVWQVKIAGSHNVPEPQQYALFAGLGLLAFGAYRRMRA